MLRILHTNDLHGTLGAACMERMRLLREECDLYFDSGDAIKAGNLAVPLRREEAWERLAELRCTASVIGNRETHVLASAFERKLEGASHPVLCANLRRKDGTHALGRSLVVEAKGVRVGIIGVMVPMVTPKMAAAAASAFLWDSPIPEAARLAEELRPKVDLLVALTHIGHRQDLLLAEACSSFDAILGGHSHTVLSSPVMVGRTAVCQGGSHCRYAGLYEWSAESGWTGGLRELA